MTSTRRRQLPGLTLAMGIGIAVAVAVSAQPAPAIASADYPTWTDVENARTSESAKQAQIADLQTRISSLTTELVTAEQVAAERGAEYEQAQGAADEAAYRSDTLDAATAEATRDAAESNRQAGQVAAMLARTTGGNLSMSLFLDAENADGLLSKLASMDKLTERTAQIYIQADADAKNLAATASQAKVAKQARVELAAAAEVALQAAIDARITLQTKLVQQRETEATMQAQLAVLTDNRAATEADYAKGEAARRAAEEAARRPSGNGGRDSGQLSGQGWALPVSGWISDSFGPRPNRPVAGVGAFHYGTDIAASCGRPVYAATGGTVVYADWLGTYGYWVLIDHGNGVQTGYAHNSELLVQTGQQVPAGANIALVGTTGASSGCHLHFEVRVDGARIDPQPFMSNRGITLG